ncbi:hypothetical protein [Xenorhabdus sp. Sc-CR9]|uniref:hypothetical protein n=1 Tax=Xenorhabdus sp. Sc-CR9 TaxID=2584468 RepID=UPI001F219CBD|nr:hypothetical protein [Xenorhabdus sp. Sc-CR9]
MLDYRTVIENGIVTLFHQQENEQEQIVISLPATAILDRVDSGEWDKQNALALQLLMAWLKTLPDGQPIDDIRFFRWIVAHVWVTKQKEKHHGRAVFKLENSPVVLPLFPSIERSALANNIEGALIERFGHEQGMKNASFFIVKCWWVHRVKVCRFLILVKKCYSSYTAALLKRVRRSLSRRFCTDEQNNTKEERYDR